MLKKILMLMLLWLSFSETLSAGDFKFDSLHASVYKDTISVGTPPLRDPFNPNPTDWVGIYKVGDSNEWSNVKLWVWAKDFKLVEDAYGNYSYHFTNITLPSGEYEARYFLNNTFTTKFKSQPFMVASDEIHGDYNPKKNSLYMEVRDKNFNPNPKDWIGVYKADDSNDWKNVRAWVWAQDLKKNQNNFYGYLFKNPDIHSGEYEIRYFLNNTFKTHKQSKTFKVQTIQLSGSFEAEKNHSVFVEIKNKNFNPNPQDWIGVYPVGASNDWSNVQAWLWAKDLKKDANGYYRHQFKHIRLDGMWGDHFELRYFLNNTFHTYQTSNEFEFGPGANF